MRMLYQIDLLSLACFVAVFREGSLERGASTVGRSIAATSRRIQGIEASLGIVLVEHVGRSLSLTHKGRHVFSLACKLLESVADFENGIADVDTIQPLRIGTFPALGQHLVAPAVARILKRNLSIQPSFVFAEESALIAKLLNAEVDVLVLIGASALPKVQSVLIGASRLVVVHAAQVFRRVEELRAHRLLAWTGPNDSTFNRASRFARRHNLMDARSIHAAHIETLKSLAREGVGYAILPEYTVQKEISDGSLHGSRFPGLSTDLPVRLFMRKGSDAASLEILANELR